MYHSKLNIIVFSASEGLTASLEKVPVPDRIEIKFLPQESVFEPYCCSDADVIILDLPVLSIASNIRDFCTSDNTWIILCDGAAEENEDLCRLRMAADEIWPQPISVSKAQLCFAKTLSRIKKIHEARLTEKYLDTLIDASPDLIWFKDARGSHLKVNSCFCRIVGKTKEECRNRGHFYIWDLTPEEYSDGEYVCLETENEVMRAGKTCIFDEKVKCRDEMRHFKTYKTPLFDDDGSVMGTVGMARDVTDLHNIDTELSIIMNSMTSPALMLDKNNKIMNVNTRFTEFFGDSRDSVLQTDYFEWKAKRLTPPVFSEEGQEADLICATSTVNFNINEEQIYDIFHNKVGTFCIYMDMSEHKRHVELLATYRKKLENDVLNKTQEIRTMQKQMIVSFANIIESRDSVTGSHIKNTSCYVDILVRELLRSGVCGENLTPDYAAHISLAAPMHDIGKVGIPDAILNKPGKYLPEEYEIMKKHSALGGEIVNKTMANIEDKLYYRLAYEMAEWHHERWDGTGYPDRLSGQAIPLSARIMAVADVFDALVAERPYKKAFSVEKAFSIIKEGSGSQFDPEIINAFIAARPLVEAELTTQTSEHIAC